MALGETVNPGTIFTKGNDRWVAERSLKQDSGDESLVMAYKIVQDGDPSEFEVAIYGSTELARDVLDSARGNADISDLQRGVRNYARHHLPSCIQEDIRAGVASLPFGTQLF